MYNLVFYIYELGVFVASFFSQKIKKCGKVSVPHLRC